MMTLSNETGSTKDVADEPLEKAQILRRKIILNQLQEVLDANFYNTCI